MDTDDLEDLEPQIAEAVGELRRTIRQRYPEATFDVKRGEDPAGIYVLTTVDLNDTEEVLDLVIDRLLQMQIDEALPVYVIPRRPTRRVVEKLRATAAGKPRQPSTTLLPDQHAGT